MLGQVGRCASPLQTAPSFSIQNSIIWHHCLILSNVLSNLMT